MPPAAGRRGQRRFFSAALRASVNRRFLPQALCASTNRLFLRRTCPAPADRRFLCGAASPRGQDLPLSAFRFARFPMQGALSSVPAERGGGYFQPGGSKPQILPPGGTSNQSPSARTARIETACMPLCGKSSLVAVRKGGEDKKEGRGAQSAAKAISPRPGRSAPAAESPLRSGQAAGPGRGGGPARPPARTSGGPAGHSAPSSAGRW